jgi:hypothetical protein
VATGGVNDNGDVLDVLRRLGDQYDAGQLTAAEFRQAIHQVIRNATAAQTKQLSVTRDLVATHLRLSRQYDSGEITAADFHRAWVETVAQHGTR